ncbi:NAD(P)/FAD-dependent oxidoreductase [Stieleria sp. ICT_E10.1]|uniref:dihydrolipoyl dehydrogenase family protein n=1 Tax=Stieleria sedimenti TaxID=2976331 RepID=UPI00217F913D|nr:NAD(P)/FAD-dependent oxidoreductase [Stieleria sedimenti]MCS7469953.1 NAD(P)/FAD-dependent oxidoreductase [Stieleria sedimenti]
MRSDRFDLIAIGTGPSASTIAKKTADDGKRVAVIESREYGGTCALRGCNPKKVYTNAADLIDRVCNGQDKFIESEELHANWTRLLRFKREFTDPVLDHSEASFQKRGIATFHGEAAFIDPTTVRVGEQQLSGDRIFIGVGAHPRPLGVRGGELVIRSDEFLDLETIPQQIVFIGGGYISMEFACVAARFGSQVTVLERGGRVLSPFDPDLVKQLVHYGKLHGIDVRTHAEVAEISQRDDGSFVVHYGEPGRRQATLEADLVVHGAGRVPNLGCLNLKAGKIAFGDDGIKVDSQMRSISNPVVYSAGDCADTGKPRLTPVANEEARAVVENLFAEHPQDRPDCGQIPKVAFTVPPIASVGMSQHQAEESHNVVVHHQDTSLTGSVRKSLQPCGGYKLLIDKDSDRILGAHLIGPAADETINLFALAMKFGLTAADIKSTLFAFPTHASDVRQML